MIIGYARTSTKEQEAGFKDQLKALKKAGCEKIFSEQVSSVKERDELEKALEWVREGDIFVVTKLDRLARNVMQFNEIVEFLNNKGVGMKILDFNGGLLDTTSATGKLMLNVSAAFAQFEREVMLERQKVGIAKAKSEGKYKGRPKNLKLQKRIDEEISHMNEGDPMALTPKQICQKLNISPRTFYKRLHEVAPEKIHRRLTKKVMILHAFDGDEELYKVTNYFDARKRDVWKRIDRGEINNVEPSHIDRIFGESPGDSDDSDGDEDSEF